MPLATVHLLRHGEVHNPDRVLYGRLPEFHLSELGRTMAQRAAEYFAARRKAGAKIVLLAASPLDRAQETAAPTAAALGLEILTEPRIIEATNHFEGLSRIRGQLRQPRHWPYLVNPLRPSWGEPYSAQVERMMEAVRDLRDRAVEIGVGALDACLASAAVEKWQRKERTERPRAHRHLEEIA